MFSPISILLLIAIMSDNALYHSANCIAEEEEQGGISCAVRRQIDPCTCKVDMKPNENTKRWLHVRCSKMLSFQQVVNALRNKFENTVEVLLHIEQSDLNDLSTGRFRDIHGSLRKIKMNSNNMSNTMTSDPFQDIGNVLKQLSLSDIRIPEFPAEIFVHMPLVEQLEFTRTPIDHITEDDFKNLNHIRYLIVRECHLKWIERQTFPPTLEYAQLNFNNLTGLNHTLSNQMNTIMLWLDHNNITSLEGELPDSVINKVLQFVQVSNNQLIQLPHTIRNLRSLQNFIASHNKLVILDNVFTTSHHLRELNLEHNRLSALSPTEFTDTNLTEVNLAINQLTSLNKSMIPIKSLKKLNVSYNLLSEFSLEEIAGLKNLSFVDLSNNRISRFIGWTEGTPDPDIAVNSLHLSYNELEILEGSLCIIQNVQFLNISHNKIRYIPPTFLNGLNDLKKLDLSHNYLTTLKSFSKLLTNQPYSFPLLEVFLAAYNDIEVLGSDDLQTMPVLCELDLSHNKIVIINETFAEKLQCKMFTVEFTLWINLRYNPVVCLENFNYTSEKFKMRSNKAGLKGDANDCDMHEYEKLKYDNLNSNSSNLLDPSAITIVTVRSTS